MTFIKRENNAVFKVSLAVALSLTGLYVHAEESAPVVHYTYGMQLDIAHVISQSTPDENLDVAPVQLTYLDSSGVRHIVEYDVVGTARSN